MFVFRLTLFIIGIISLIYGSICLFKPDSGIRIFQAWCRYLNWKVEPINYDLEINSTRRFGLFGLLLSLALIYQAIFISI